MGSDNAFDDGIGGATQIRASGSMTVPSGQHTIVGAPIHVDEPKHANTRQVGGRHYGLSTFQHWDVVVKFDLDYFQGQITKYLMRWRQKNGVEDLEKAKHYLEKYIEEIKAGRIRSDKIVVVAVERPE
jgi:hypothetical protein